MDAEDEKKPFDADVDGTDEPIPDPDESLMLEQGNGRVWLVRIPKFLMERWSKIDEEDIHLASIRVYAEDKGRNGKPPRIILYLPPNRDDPTLPAPTPDPARPQFTSFTEFQTSEPDSYELDMLNEGVENTIVVAERPKDPPTLNQRARTTILTGRVKHECSLRPMFTEKYRKQMRERNRKYHTPARSLLRIEDAGIGKGSINRLSSGVGMGGQNSFSDLVKTKVKPTKGNFERMARMPKNQLLDLLFQLFKDQPRWGIKLLRERTQQPEVYLKDVLAEIAVLHRTGEHNGQWELSQYYTEDGVKGEGEAGPSSFIKPEDQDTAVATGQHIDEEDEDEDEDDMEEVS